MRKIKIRNIPQHILDTEHCEDSEYFDYLCSESTTTKALAFFGIAYDDTRSILEIPDIFDFDKAEDIVAKYCDDVELEDRPKESIANEYNIYTEPFRGADDGTFDYAGTYVSTILSVAKLVLK